MAYSARACLPGAAARISSCTEGGEECGCTEVVLIAVSVLLVCLLFAPATERTDERSRRQIAFRKRSSARPIGVDALGVACSGVSWLDAWASFSERA